MGVLNPYAWLFGNAILIHESSWEEAPHWLTTSEIPLIESNNHAVKCCQVLSLAMKKASLKLSQPRMTNFHSSGTS